MAFARYGDQSVAYRLMVPIVAEGSNLSTYLDYVLVREGRAHTMLAFRRVGTAVGSKMERRLTIPDNAEAATVMADLRSPGRASMKGASADPPA